MLDSQVIKEQAGRRGGPEWVRESKPCSPARDTPLPRRVQGTQSQPRTSRAGGKAGGFPLPTSPSQASGGKKIQSFCNPIHHSNKNDFTLIKI